MRKLSLLFTILIVSVSLNACNAGEAEKLYGSWKYSYDISALLTEADELSYFDLEEHKADVIMTFNSDGMYTFGFDEESLKNAFAEIEKELIAESEDYIEKIIAEQGLLYQLVADTIAEELREETEEEIAEMVEELYSEINVTKSGTFIAKDGKIFWDNDTDEYDVYELKDNTLTIDKPEGYEKDEMYPVTFIKAE